LESRRQRILRPHAFAVLELRHGARNLRRDAALDCAARRRIYSSALAVAENYSEAVKQAGSANWHARSEFVRPSGPDARAEGGQGVFMNVVATGAANFIGSQVGDLLDAPGAIVLSAVTTFWKSLPAHLRSNDFRHVTKAGTRSAGTRQPSTCS